MNDIRIRDIALGDLDDVVAVHCAAFPGSAMTRLGGEAVKRYYRWQLEGPHETYAHGAWLDGKLAGFCFGGIHPTAISGFLDRNKRFIAWRVATHPWLITLPMFRDRIRFGFSALRVRRENSQINTEIRREGREKAPYDILSIAVNPRAQGTGIGKLLMMRAEEAALANGFSSMTLVVRPDNENAVRFYERGGWERVLHEGGRWVGEMKKRLDLPIEKAWCTPSL